MLNPATWSQIREIENSIKFNDALLDDRGMRKKIKPGYPAELPAGPDVPDRMAWARNPLSDRDVEPLNDELFVARGYRMKAEECRAVAEEMQDPQARASLLSVALYYERLAKRHEGPLGAIDPATVRSRAASRT